jgi:hypothetical protein
VLNQYGFILFYGVILDTFVIRLLLVPPILTVLGGVRGVDMNWWPGKMPAVALPSPEAEEARLMEGHWTPTPDAHQTAAGSEVELKGAAAADAPGESRLEGDAATQAHTAMPLEPAAGDPAPNVDSKTAPTSIAAD